MFKEFLEREATAEVDRQAVLYGYSDRLMAVFVKEKEKLEFTLPGLRAAYGQKVDEWKRTRDRQGGAEPHPSPTLAKGEKRLAVLEACISILQDRIEANSAKANAESHRLESEHLMRSLRAQFRKEEREAAAKAEQERFEAWLKAKDYF
jgi:hypothetical protein